MKKKERRGELKRKSERERKRDDEDVHIELIGGWVNGDRERAHARYISLPRLHTGVSSLPRLGRSHRRASVQRLWSVRSRPRRPAGVISGGGGGIGHVSGMTTRRRQGRPEWEKEGTREWTRWHLSR